ncbi:hypothetical protein [Gimesia maris]|nr:hypothetical protein [Gimesia maris]EDL56122.1 hypothetical protein PM8797T_19228 [Gimesia maris DSM 8797]QGQ28149.1 hypothetical protein F1729_05470 [Gimesia maris]
MPSKNNEIKTLSNDHKKSLIDFFKHQTTLCTATIVLMMAITSGLLPQPVPQIVKVLLGVSAISFLGSLGSSFMALADINIYFDDDQVSKEWKFLMIFSAITFMIGLLSFMLTLLIA